MLRKADIKRALNNPLLFRDVAGYEGLYKISYNGLVYSFISDKILRPGLSKGPGYLSVVLWNLDKTKRTHYIHRLVAEAFIPNPAQKRCVNHILGSKKNNHKDWLEWATHKENNDHATATGLRKVKCTPEVISQIVSLHIKAHPSFGAKALAQRFGIDKSVIHEILNKHKYHAS